MAPFTAGGAYDLLQESTRVAAATGWRLLTSTNTAGTYNYTVPEGVYEIGVFIIGGGGSGGASSGPQAAASGGASGHTKVIILPVTPGQRIPLIIGVGGAAVSTTAYSSTGNTGGSTSFNGVVALGGEGGGGAQYRHSGANGGQGSSHTASIYPAPAMGLVDIRTGTGTSNSIKSGITTPTESFNPFDCLRYLSAGAAHSLYDSITQTYTTADDGSHGGIPSSKKGVGKGSGGSGYAASSGTATSGAGSPGAALIYARRAL